MAPGAPIHWCICSRPDIQQRFFSYSCMAEILGKQCSLSQLGMIRTEAFMTGEYLSTAAKYPQRILSSPMA